MALRYDKDSQYPEELISNYNPMKNSGIQKQLDLFEQDGGDENDE